MSKKKKLPFKPWEITNYKWDLNFELKDKIQKIINDFYKPDRIELIKKNKVSREEVEKLEPWPLNKENLDNVEILVQNSLSYGDDETVMKNILSDEKYKYNNDLNIIALKVSLIDLLNSTQISKQKSRATLKQIAEKIKNCNFDERVKNYDPKLVEDIAFCGKDGKLWSFASKYVTYHNRFAWKKDDYAIIDSKVKENIHIYANKFGFDMDDNKFKKIFDAKHETYIKNTPNGYDEFVKTIQRILKEAKCDFVGNKKMFDHFLWWQFKDFSIKKKKIIYADI